MPQKAFAGTERFVVRRQLGRGGMGTVYLVWDRERRMDVALKVLSSLDADGIYRLKSEFRSLADVSHPNLVGLYDLVSSESGWFFTMELVEGTDFLSWVRGHDADPTVPRALVSAETVADLDSDHPTEHLPAEANTPSEGLPVANAAATGPSGTDAAAVRASAPELPLRHPDSTMQEPDPLETLDDTVLGLHPAQLAADATNAETIAAGDTSALYLVKPVTLVRGKVANEQRLRAALRQLAKGIRAIHAAGKLHRDIKPSNALVDPSGRVVLLDFGLVSEGKQNLRESQHDQGISGTPAYMAPEQANGRGAVPASDWYAVGVMLYEALTGQLPFSGSWFALLEAKLHRRPVPPEMLRPDAPADLCQLCNHLLATDPADRPRESEILTLLGGRQQSEPGLSLGRDDEPPLLGREDAVLGLDACWSHVQGGAALAVHVTGPAGMGKSALVSEWLRKPERSEWLVLQGRCHEREAVPYKAWDALVDSLTRWLLRQPEEQLANWLPADIAALAAIFPVLQRVPAIAQASRRELELLDKRGVRTRAFAVCKQLLRRLGHSRPLVLVLDDLQWADVDSVELLTTLLQGHDAPALLACLLYRAEDMHSTTVGGGLRKLMPPLADFAARELALGPLSREACAQLALQMLTQQAGHDPATIARRAEIIAREAQGSPLFAVELVRFRDDRALSGQTSVTSGQVSLDDLLLARVAGLPAAARTLLHCVAMAGKPTAQGVVLHAADLGKEALSALVRLRSAHFVRTSGDGDKDTVETFHNRIREVLLRNLPESDQRALHLRLGEALLHAEPEAPDAEALARHFRGAGDDERALHWSLAAARHAHAVHANREALQHYDAALGILSRRSDADALRLRHRVQEEAAEAGRQAGLYDKALELAQLAMEAAQTELERADAHVGIGRILQEKGDSDAALVALETGLRLYGRPLPANLAVLGVQVLWQWLIHFLYAFAPALAKTDTSDPTLQKRLDTMFALIRIYYFIDVAKVTWAGLHTINLARRLDKEENRSLAFSFYGVMMMGIGQLPRAQRWCEQGLSLARKVGSPVAEAVALSRLGTQANFANDMTRAERTLREACDLFKSVGEMWELQTALMMLATTRFMVGDFRGAEPLYRELGDYGVQLNAVMFQGWSKSWAPFCRYLVGEQDEASVQVELEEATELSARAKDVANTAAALMHMTAVAVREGQVERSAGLAVRTLECIDRYLVQVPFLQAALIEAGDAALFALERGAMSVPRRRLLAIARRGWKKSRRMAADYTYLLGPSLRLQARYVQLTVSPQAAEPLYDQAIAVLERSPNRWETALALLDAAGALPNRRDDLRRRARRILEDLGAVAELRRMDQTQSNATTSRRPALQAP